MLACNTYIDHPKIRQSLSWTAVPQEEGTPARIRIVITKRFIPHYETLHTAGSRVISPTRLATILISSDGSTGLATCIW